MCLDPETVYANIDLCRRFAHPTSSQPAQGRGWLVNQTNGHSSGHLFKLQTSRIERIWRAFQTSPVGTPRHVSWILYIRPWVSPHFFEKD